MAGGRRRAFMESGQDQSRATWWAGLPLLNVIARLAELDSASLMAQLVKNPPAVQETQEMGL